MRAAIFATTLVASLTLACTQTAVCDATADCLPSVITVGSDAVLAPGRPMRVESSDVSLMFERIVSDSRCPTDAMCVWAGNALARIQVRVGTSAPSTVEINSMLDPKTADAGPYRIVFVALAPETNSTRSIDPAAYRLTVRVEQR